MQQAQNREPPALPSLPAAHTERGAHYIRFTRRRDGGKAQRARCRRPRRFQFRRISLRNLLSLFLPWRSLSKSLRQKPETKLKIRPKLVISPMTFPQQAIHAPPQCHGVWCIRHRKTEIHTHSSSPPRHISKAMISSDSGCSCMCKINSKQQLAPATTRPYRSTAPTQNLKLFTHRIGLQNAA